MKRLITLTIATLVIGVGLLAQPTKELKKIIELKMQGEGGANGGSVVWHPVLKKYYAAIAGNIVFPFGVFDIDGKLLTPPIQEAMFDIRGLWYNPMTKTIQMNGYKDFGWAEYTLDPTTGIPTEVNPIITGLNQPNEQCAGAFDPINKSVYFLNLDGNVERYDVAQKVFREIITLHIGQTDANATNKPILGDYNYTTVVYTGQVQSELGLLNTGTSTVELYNLADGYLTKKLVLPADAPLELSLNFAYTNGIVWLFNKTTRTWMGYR